MLIPTKNETNRYAVRLNALEWNIGFEPEKEKNE